MQWQSGGTHTHTPHTHVYMYVYRDHYVDRDQFTPSLRLIALICCTQCTHNCCMYVWVHTPVCGGANAVICLSVMLRLWNEYISLSVCAYVSGYKDNVISISLANCLRLCSVYLHRCLWAFVCVCVRVRVWSDYITFIWWYEWYTVVEFRKHLGTFHTNAFVHIHTTVCTDI